MNYSSGKQGNDPDWSRITFKLTDIDWPSCINYIEFDYYDTVYNESVHMETVRWLQITDHSSANENITNPRSPLPDIVELQIVNKDVPCGDDFDHFTRVKDLWLSDGNILCFHRCMGPQGTVAWVCQIVRSRNVDHMIRSNQSQDTGPHRVVWQQHQLQQHNRGQQQQQQSQIPGPCTGHRHMLRCQQLTSSVYCLRAQSENWELKEQISLLRYFFLTS